MSEGTQLASGYVDLTVKYKDAQSQIARTFDGFVSDAEKASKQAGDALADGLGEGAKKGAKEAQQYIAHGDIAKTLAKELGSAGDKASKELLRSLAAGNEQAKRNAQIAGKNYAAALKAGTSGAGADAARKFESEFRNALHAREASQVFFDEFHRDGVAMGERVGTAIGKTISAGIKLGAVGAAGAVAAIGYSLTKGFERLEKIDQARFKLSALGNSATDVDEIMRNAQSSVEHTAFSLDQAATSAASAVAAGIKPGKQLTGYLTTVADTAAIAGTSFEDMASIFNKVTTSNKAYTDDLNQLADRGIPIFKWLQDEYHVSADALRKMVEDGKVDAAGFDEAISTHIGGAAQKMGQSFGGAMDNMHASIARLGANFIASVFGGPGVNPLATPTEAVGVLTDKLNLAGEWVKAHGPQIHDFFTKAKDAGKQFIDAVLPPLQTITEVLREHPGLITAVAGAFVAWKVIDGIVTLTTSLKAISKLLKVELPASAATGSAGIAAAFSKAGPAVLALLAVGAIADELGPKLANLVGNWTGENHAPISTTDFDQRLADVKAQAAAGNIPGVKIDPATGNMVRDGAAPSQPSVVVPGIAGAPTGNHRNDPNFTGAAPDHRNDPNFTGAPGTVLGARGGPTVGGGQGLPALAGRVPYGLPSGSNSGGYGGNGVQFPPWVYQLGTAFGVKPSTYAGHQESNRAEAGFAPDPGGLNRGIDWSGPVENMQRFADYLASIPGDLEQVIWQNPQTGKRIGVAGGQDVSGSGYYAGDYGDHTNHVHTRQSMSIPLPPWLMPGFASGGAAAGPGGPTADKIPAMLSDGEHVWTAAEVNAVGGQANMYKLRQMALAGMLPGFNTGGAVDDWRSMVAGQGQQPRWTEDVLQDQLVRIGSARSSGGRSIRWAPGENYGKGNFNPNIALDPSTSTYTDATLNGLLAPKASMSMDMGEEGIPVLIDIANQNGPSAVRRAADDYLQNTDPMWRFVNGLGPGDGRGVPNLRKIAGYAEGGPVTLEDLLKLDGTDPNATQHGAAGQNVAPGPTPDQLQQFFAAQQGGDQSGVADGRTQGYIPAGAGNTGQAGSSFASGLLNMGSEALGGVLDMAAQAASMAATVGSFGAGAAGGSQAAGAAIGMGTQAAKRGIQYGFQMAGIGIDALAEILMPFGVPRFFQTDPTAFIPQLPGQQAAVTTGEKAQLQQDDPAAAQQNPEYNPAGPVQPGQLPGAQPVGAPAAPAQAGGVAPGPVPMAAGAPPVAPTGPAPAPAMPRGNAPGPSAPGPADPLLKNFGIFDRGGILEPGAAAINKSRRAEPMAVFTGDQWGTLKSIASQDAAKPVPGGGPDFSIHLANVTVKDVNDLESQLSSKQRLQMMRYAGRP